MKSKIKEQEIVVIQRNVVYPEFTDVYSPSELYPEYPFSEKTLSHSKNDVYQMIRDGFIKMELDKEHIGFPEWNPLGEIIKPGDYVLLKPNMVLHENQIKENGTDCLITHPSVVRAVLDYVVKALGKTGHIVVGDASLQSCNFEKLIENHGYNSLIDFYKKQDIVVELCDFRLVKSQVKHGIVDIVEKTDEDNCTVVELGKLSEHQNEGYERLRVTNYNPDMMQHHHNEHKHEYMVATPILLADVIINLPKPKTHRKAGITGALKNLIGINGNKDWLPHHKKGSISSGGDEYKDKNAFKKIESDLLDCINRGKAQNFMVAQVMRMIRHVCMVLGNWTANDRYVEGSWYGNDTIWRTIIDLNRILLYADKSGIIQENKQRKTFIIGDMIISGEGEGPLMPSPIHAGTLVMGWNAVAFDTIVADIMGFDYLKIPSICNNYQQKNYPLIDFSKDEIELLIDTDTKNKPLQFAFKPTSGWKGHIEKETM